MPLLSDNSNPAFNEPSLAFPKDQGAVTVPGQPLHSDSEESMFDSAKIMIVDDEVFNTKIVRRFLQSAGYKNFIIETDSRKVIDRCRVEKPDLVLLDIIMPEVSGMEILRARHGDPELERMGIIILSASGDTEVKREALDMGATDFLNKPVDTNELFPRVRNTLLMKSHQDRLENYAEILEQQVTERTRELRESREQIIHCLARAAEFRDNDTGQHVIRVGMYSRIISEELGFSKDQSQDLELAAQLHDVGKIGIPDAILLNPKRLTATEYEVMRGHCSIGKTIIDPLTEEDSILNNHTVLGANILDGNSSPLLSLASVIAQSHHERYDGSGYPLGLKGKEIPIEGRIVAVADVYDALSSHRPYKQAFEEDRCFELILRGRGEHFDPECVDAFFSRVTDIVKITEELGD
ncbi:response regulator [Mariniblastus sp.]|nr:HD domain-containing phosphohydrolase [Mariniblastus sp.]MDB4671236.1 response regulator [Pirellulaceae bacterium]MDB4756848.1 response regulator [Mariniblastus sp.]